jgi:hypothetical protein
MPRNAKSIATIAAPFGGLATQSSNTSSDPRNCVDCNNVMTSVSGCISKRKGASGFGPANGAAGNVLAKLAPIFVNDQYLLEAYYTSISNHVVVNYYVVNANGSNVLTVAGAVGTNVGRPTILSFNNRAYALNGAMADNLKFYIKSATLVAARVGILPVADPTVGIGFTTGGFTSGTIASYRLTWYNNDDGTESPASGETQGIAVAAPDCFHIGYTASTNPQVTHIRIYRKITNPATDSTWYLLATVANDTSTYVDNNTVTVTKTLANAIRLGMSVPPASHVACWHKRRMWYTYESTVTPLGLPIPTTIVYSEIDEPELVNILNDFQFGSDRSDYIVGMTSFSGYLIVWTLQNMYAVVGDGPQSFYVQKIASGGLIAKDAWCEYDGVLYYAGPDLVRSYDGSTVRNISLPDDPRRSCITSYPWSATYFADINASYEPVSGNIVFTGIDNTTVLPRQLVYDPRGRNWFYWDLPAFCVTVQAWNTTGPTAPLMFFGGYGGVLVNHKIGMYAYQGTDTELDSTFVAWFWRTHSMDLGLRRRKIFYYAGLTWNSSPVENINLQWAVENNAFGAIVGRVGNQSPRVGKWKIAQRGIWLNLKISGQTSIGPSIESIDIDALPTGYR